MRKTWICPNCSFEIPWDVLQKDFPVDCKCGKQFQYPDGCAEVPNLRFVRKDFGAGQRSRDSADCTVRALAAAAGLSYQDAYAKLYAAQGRHNVCSFIIQRFLNIDAKEFCAPVHLSFLSEYEMTVEKFAEQYPKGRWILYWKGHVAALVDSVLYDKVDCRKSVVLDAWQIQPQAPGK